LRGFVVCGKEGRQATVMLIRRIIMLTFTFRLSLQKLFAVLVLMGIASTASAGQLYTEFPQTIDADGRYVFYSHGFIVEGTNPTPEHPRFGTYDFPAIKNALVTGDFNLIAYHRPAGTNPAAFAKNLAGDVKRLVAGGVNPAHITLLGFSRGSMITAMANSNLAMPKLNTVLMAICGNWIARRADMKLAGRILSVFETSDRFGTCQALIDQSPAVTSFTEIAISTGKAHGAFFTPRKEWLEPVLAWIAAGK
jgi:hypothetical protein